MAASFSDATYVGPHVASLGTRVWEFTVNDTVTNSKASGYNSFWSPLAHAFRYGDIVKVTCNDGKWLGIVVGCDGAGVSAANWSVTLDPAAGDVDSF